MWLRVVVLPERQKLCLYPLQASAEPCRTSAIGTLSLSFVLSYKEIGQEAKNQELGRRRSFREKMFLLDWKLCTLSAELL